MQNPLPILFEDPHLVAVDKPAWWVVHPTKGARDAPVVLRLLRDQLGQALYPVHRLDRQVSGVLVLARSSEMARRLSDDIREGQWHKRYLGLCRGVFSSSLRIDHPVREGEARRPALTQVETLQAYLGRYTLVQANPTTGRHHQIRYHLKHADHPLVGDTSYGQGPINRFFRAQFGLGRLFLHAQRLRLPHPVENRYLELESPLPEALGRVLDELSRYQGPVP